MKIQEILDSPYELHNVSNSGMFRYASELPDHNILINFVDNYLYVSHIAMDISMRESDFIQKYNIGTKERLLCYDIMFGLSGSKDAFYINSYRATDQGDQFRIFATVKKAIDVFIQDSNKRFDILYFEAMKKYDTEQVSKSRKRLYDIFAPKLAKVLGFAYERGDNEEKCTYYLINTEHIGTGI